MNTTILKDTLKPVFHLLFFFSYLPLNCCHTLFFLNAFSLHLCNLEMFLKTSVERKMRKQYKDVILQHIRVFFLSFVLCLFFFFSLQQNDDQFSLSHLLTPLPVQTQQVLMTAAGFSINNTGKKSTCCVFLSVKR